MFIEFLRIVGKSTDTSIRNSSVCSSDINPHNIGAISGVFNFRKEILMKNRIILSIVMTIILTISMSFACFASENTWSLNTSEYVEDFSSSLPLATGTRSYSYHSYNMVLDYSVSVTSLAVVGNNKSLSNISLSVRKTNQSYSDVYNDYVHTPGITYGFDVYVLAVVPSKSYTTVDSFSSNYSTGTTSYSNYFIPNTNSLYYFRNYDSSYYNTQYIGQLNYSIIFGLQNYTQPHIFY